MKSVSGKATFKKNFNLVLQKLPKSEFKFFLISMYDIYTKKYEIFKLNLNTKIL